MSASILDYGSSICPKCEQDIHNEVKLRKATLANYRLREMLKDAWLLGSIHDRPSFEQLKQWHAMLNTKE
jgi:hypothetical protein